MVSTWPRLSQTFVLDEILALERRGVDVRIYSTKRPGDEPTHAKVAKVRAPVAYLSLRGRAGAVARAHARMARRRPRAYVRTLLAAARLCRPVDALHRFLQAGFMADMLWRQPVRHLHAHFATGPTLIAMLAHRLIGTPYSFTAHARDIYVDTPPTLLRAEMERAQAVVTVTDYNRRFLLGRILPEADGKVVCVRCGLDLSEFPFRWPRESAPGPPTILAVARLVEKKGLEDLVLAAAALRRRGHALRVHIIGDGPLLGRLQSRVAEHALQDCVTFLGSQPHEAVRAAYERASIFALPCVLAEDGDRDGLPVALLEAMASGLPVVSTSVSGIPELIDTERDGLIVPPGDVPALATALERLVTSPSLRDRIAAGARAKIEERFSIDRSAEQLMSVFEPPAQQGEVPCLRS